jgi:hypothetical protein
MPGYSFEHTEVVICHGSRLTELLLDAPMLNSWKEIAQYLGRSVRTIQRWENTLGLPVRRPRGQRRSAVVALKDDLDRWIQRTEQLKASGPQIAPERLGVASENIRTLLARRDRILANTRNLRAETKLLTEHLRESLERTRALALSLNKQRKKPRSFKPRPRGPA